MVDSYINKFETLISTVKDNKIIFNNLSIKCYLMAPELMV